MNKLIVNHVDKIFVTTDTATIMKEMEIVHPAAKMIVLASNMQESEVGDGSNFVVCLAGELLNQAEKLLRKGLHPSDIITGYTLAGKKALEILTSLVCETVEKESLRDLTIAARGVKTAISAKQLGIAPFLTDLVTRACQLTLTDNIRNFTVDNVRVVKILGGSISDSEVVSGMVIGRGAEGKVTEVFDAKVAMFTCSIAPTETETKGVVTLTTAQQLLDYSTQEERDMEVMIRSIHESGVTMIISGGAVSDTAAHYLEKYKIMVLRIASKFELRRLAKLIGCRGLVSLGPVSAEHQGFAKHIYVKEIGGRDVTVFQKDSKVAQVSTILLRASTHNVLNDVERAIDDGCNTFQAMARDARFVAGAGAVDIEMAKQLTAFGSTVTGLTQYAVKAYAKSFEIVPHILAENAGLNSLDSIASLYTAHADSKTGAVQGLNVSAGGVVNVLETGVLDLLSTKEMGLKLATDVAVTILRVDKIISAKPAGGPQGKKGGHWDDDD